MSMRRMRKTKVGVAGLPYVVWNTDGAGKRGMGGGRGLVRGWSNEEKGMSDSFSDVILGEQGNTGGEAGLWYRVNSDSATLQHRHLRHSPDVLCPSNVTKQHSFWITSTSASHRFITRQHSDSTDAQKQQAHHNQCRIKSKYSHHSATTPKDSSECGQSTTVPLDISPMVVSDRKLGQSARPKLNQVGSKDEEEEKTVLSQAPAVDKGAVSSSPDDVSRQQRHADIFVTTCDNCASYTFANTFVSLNKTTRGKHDREGYTKQEHKTMETAVRSNIMSRNSDEEASKVTKKMKKHATTKKCGRTLVQPDKGQQFQSLSVAEDLV